MVYVLWWIGAPDVLNALDEFKYVELRVHMFPCGRDKFVSIVFVMMVIPSIGREIGCWQWRGVIV